MVSLSLLPLFRVLSFAMWGSRRLWNTDTTNDSLTVKSGGCLYQTVCGQWWSIVAKEALFRWFRYLLSIFKVHELRVYKKSERLSCTCMFMAIIALLARFKVTWRQIFFGILHVDPKPLNIEMTQWNRLRNVKGYCVFYPEKTLLPATCVCLTDRDVTDHFHNMAATFYASQRRMGRLSILCLWLRHPCH